MCAIKKISLLLSVALILLSQGCSTNDEKVEKIIKQFKGEVCYWHGDGSRVNFFDKWTRRSFEANCKIAAAKILGEMGSDAKEAVPALVDALRNGPNDIATGDGLLPYRSTIALTLAKIGDSKAINPLIEKLKIKEKPTISSGASYPANWEFPVGIGHKAIAEALGTFGPQAKEATPYIIPLLKYSGEQWQIKYTPPSAAEALGKIKNTRSIPALIDAIENGPCDTDLCAAEAAEALGNFGSQAKASIPALEKLLKKYPDYCRITSAIKKALKAINNDNK